MIKKYPLPCAHDTVKERCEQKVTHIGLVSLCDEHYDRWLKRCRQTPDERIKDMKAKQHERKMAELTLPTAPVSLSRVRYVPSPYEKIHSP